MLRFSALGYISESPWDLLKTLWVSGLLNQNFQVWVPDSSPPPRKPNQTNPPPQKKKKLKLFWPATRVCVSWVVVVDAMIRWALFWVGLTVKWRHLTQTRSCRRKSCWACLRNYLNKSFFYTLGNFWLFHNKNGIGTHFLIFPFWNVLSL